MSIIPEYYEEYWVMIREEVSKTKRKVHTSRRRKRTKKRVTTTKEERIGIGIGLIIETHMGY